LQRLTQMDLALRADMTTGEGMAAAIASIGFKPIKAEPKLKFGFPNEYTMASGAYRACWEGKLEIGIAADYSFIIWRGMNLSGPVTRINCDGLLHALALIHHLLDQHNIPLTQRGNVNE